MISARKRNVSIEQNLAFFQCADVTIYLGKTRQAQVWSMLKHSALLPTLTYFFISNMHVRNTSSFLDVSKSAWWGGCWETAQEDVGRWVTSILPTQPAWKKWWRRKGSSKGPNNSHDPFFDHDNKVAAVTTSSSSSFATIFDSTSGEGKPCFHLSLSHLPGEHKIKEWLGGIAE